VRSRSASGAVEDTSAIVLEVAAGRANAKSLATSRGAERPSIASIPVVYVPG